MRLLLLRIIVLCLAISPAHADPIRTVAVVNAPLAYIAQTLGGDGLEVIYPVPLGVDPAFWQPGQQDVQLYQHSDLILLNGAGYAKWVETQILPRARLVDTTAAVRDHLIPASQSGIIHKHGPEGEHVHDGAFAITTWLDPKFARAQVDAAAMAMSARWPDLAAQIAERTLSLHEEIAAMDAAFSEFFKGVSDKQIFASHPVYQYLDRAYSTEITSLLWEPDTEPGDAQWSDLEAMLDKSRQPVILWESKPIALIAERLDSLGVEQIVLDPMANLSPPEALFQKLTEQIPGR